LRNDPQSACRRAQVHGGHANDPSGAVASQDLDERIDTGADVALQIEAAEGTKTIVRLTSPL
jgi:hypothetical protein